MAREGNEQGRRGRSQAVCRDSGQAASRTRFSEAVWKQSLYKRRSYVTCGARLRMDLLDNRPFTMLLEISKRLICWTLVSGQPLSTVSVQVVKTSRLR